MSKSNLDVEGRERARRKEELLNLKKRAAWIAKEVTTPITSRTTDGNGCGMGMVTVVLMSTMVMIISCH